MLSPINHADATQSDSAVQRIDARPGVLVVDDEPFIRSMVQWGLERSGFNVFAASTGEEAINLFQTHKKDIAVVLLDVCMPNVDGPQVLEQLQKLNLDVPACFMSADTGMYEPDELLRRGAAQIIAKPFRAVELANILRQLT
jgi:CheY-like chemotaxis protein